MNTACAITHIGLPTYANITMQRDISTMTTKALLLRQQSTALARRTLPRRSLHTSRALLAAGAGHHEPPLPAFARSPRKMEPLVENIDATWDDGVAPELALDFDSPNVSTREAMWTWAAGFGAFFVLYQTLKLFSWAGSGNPALPHEHDVVDEDYSDVLGLKKKKDDP